jgi:acyl-CoA synthetase (AMP-forming)/AMP-acid ligase II
VEAVLLRHRSIREIAVIGLPHDGLGEEVAAVAIVSRRSRVTASQLEQYARRHLSYFEVPTRWWIRREPLPVNGVGKVLKRELREAWPATQTGD